MKDIVGWGTTGLVVYDESTYTIIKSPMNDFDHDAATRIAREIQVYQRLEKLGGHKGTLTYHGTFESGIRLEFAPNYGLRSYIQKHDVDLKQKLRWACQIAEAVQFIHDAGIIHGDLTNANIMLDKDLNTKVADFAGSSIDGSELLIVVTTSHEYPGSLLCPQADIFAFGSLFYELMTGERPYKDVPEREIEARYAKGDFPDTTSLLNVGTVIRKCWQGNYARCENVIEELRHVELSTPTEAQTRIA